MQACEGFILRVADRSLLLSTVVIQLKEKSAMNEDCEKQSIKANKICLCKLNYCQLNLRKVLDDKLSEKQSEIGRNFLSQLAVFLLRMGVMLLSFFTNLADLNA